MTSAPRNIKELFDAKIQSSGLTLKHCKKLQFETLSPVELEKLKLPAAWSMRIPYFNPRGEKTKFYRLRYLEDLRSGFEVAAGKKQLRYIQPAGTINEIYLPPILDWADIAKNTSIPIIITEGELKAACAAANGMACIGLGGVWCFRSTANNMQSIPAMKWLLWEGREVTIMFDSDAATNPDIMRAEHALANLLTDFGAKVKIARMPRINGFAKTGLDDFITHSGHEALEPILLRASDFAASSALHELNGEVVYVRNPGIIVKLETNQRMTPKSFIDHAYSTRTYTEVVMSGDNSKMVVRSAPKEWIKWPLRTEVEKVTYAPGKPRVYDGYLNTWEGWGVEPKEGDVSLWNELLDYLFAGDNEARTWFEKWLAYPLQYPGTKLYTTAVLWGVNQGTGKSLIAYTLKRIYGKNFTEIEEENLSATHNEWAENKQFILGDDVTGKEHRAYADKLKGMISRQVLRLNPKYIPSYEVPDCINYYFTSNQPDAFFLENLDRRFFIHEVTRAPLTIDFYDRYDKWYRSEEGAAALFAHLLKIDVSKFNPRAAAQVTSSKLAMIEDGRSDLAVWVNRLKTDPDGVLTKSGDVIPHHIWRTEDLLKVYDPLNKTRVTLTGMARELKRADITRAAGGNQVKTCAGHVRLWVVRDTDTYLYARDHEIAKRYDAERSDQPPKAKKPVGYDLRKGKKKSKLL